MAKQQINQSQAQGTTLGYAQSTSDFSTSSTTAVQVTGVRTTVTVPTGGRRVKITISAPGISNNSTNGSRISLWQGTVGTGTLLTFAQGDPYVAGAVAPVSITYSAILSAGSYTFNAGLSANAGTATIYSTISTFTGPIAILVELA
jgi:hypothetical protein